MTGLGITPYPHSTLRPKLPLHVQQVNQQSLRQKVSYIGFSWESKNHNGFLTQSSKYSVMHIQLINHISLMY